MTGTPPTAHMKGSSGSPEQTVAYWGISGTIAPRVPIRSLLWELSDYPNCFTCITKFPESWELQGHCCVINPWSSAWVQRVCWRCAWWQRLFLIHIKVRVSKVWGHKEKLQPDWTSKPGCVGERSVLFWRIITGDKINGLNFPNIYTWILPLAHLKSILKIC